MAGNCPNCIAVNSTDVAIIGKKQITYSLFFTLFSKIGDHHLILGMVI